MTTEQSRLGRNKWERVGLSETNWIWSSYRTSVSLAIGSSDRGEEHESE